MKKSFVFTFIMVVVGSIVGAGFVSGKEIVSFFGNIGFWALPFVLVVGVLFFCCFALFSKLGKIIKPQSISDINKAVFGKAYVIPDLLCVLSTFITLASMLAGCDSLGGIVFGARYNFCYISVACCVLVAIILNYGLSWIYKTNNVITPVILTLIFLVGVGFLIFVPKSSLGIQTTFLPFSASLSSALYVAMNVFTNIFIVAASSRDVNKKQSFVACVATAIILVIFIMLILLCILFGGDKIFLSDMPMLQVAYSLGNGFGNMYAIVMGLAIFTTICNAAFTIQMWLNNFIKNKFLCGVITLLAGFVFSRFGFATIVEVFYPLEGAFAFVLIACCVVYYFKLQRKTKNKVGRHNAEQILPK